MDENDLPQGFPLFPASQDYTNITFDLFLTVLTIIL